MILDADSTKHRLRWGALGVVGLASTLYLFRLGRGALVDWDEAIHAQVSKLIVERHEWLTLFWNYGPYFRKPPLSFWIRATLFHLFGATEFSARLASACAGIAVVLLVYAMAKRAGSAAAIFAAITLLMTSNFTQIVRHGTTDALLCLCIYLAMYAYVCRPGGDRRAFYLMCFAMGAGAMVKGPAVLIAPLAIAVDSLAGGEPRLRLSRRDCLTGIMLVFALVLPWHLWMLHAYGRAFLDEYFVNQIWERATGVVDGSGGGPLYYVKVLGVGALGCTLVAALAFAWRFWTKQWEQPVYWNLALMTLLMYSAIPTKHEWYIAPMYPALAIEVGKFLAGVIEERPVLRWAVTASVTLAIFGTGIQLVRSDGMPLANEMAELARTAGSQNGPLFVVVKQDSLVDIPTAVFYSNRQVTLIELPKDLPALVSRLTSTGTADVIVENAVADRLRPGMECQQVQRNELLTYAVVSQGLTRQP